jgi:hypothetical protein
MVVFDQSNNWIMRAHHRKCYYLLARFWVFYFCSDLPGFVYATSTDGINWTTRTLIEGQTAADFNNDVAYDPKNNCFWWIFDFTPAFALYINRGVPDSNGVITWETEVTVLPAGPERDDIHVAVDSLGYPWIAFTQSTDGGVTKYPWILKSSTTNTWTTQAGFPYQLSLVSNPWRVFIDPVPSEISGNGEVYLTYIFSDDTMIRGRMWDGAAMGAEQTSALGAGTIPLAFANTVIDAQGNVHIVYRRSDGSIQHKQRVYATAIWDAEVEVVTGFADTFYPQLSVIVEDTSSLCCFWIDTSVIYYKIYVDGAWDLAATTWIDATAEGVPLAGLCESASMDNGGVIGFLYTTLLAAPYNLNHAYLSVGKPKTTSHTI